MRESDVLQISSGSGVCFLVAICQFNKITVATFNGVDTMVLGFFRAPVGC